MLDLRVLPPLGTAKRAHTLISWKFALKGEVVGMSRGRLDMRKGNFEKIRYELEKQDWYKLLLNKNANESYELLLGIYHSLCEEYIPKRMEGKRKDPKWMTDEITFEIREKH